MNWLEDSVVDAVGETIKKYLKECHEKFILKTCEDVAVYPDVFNYYKSPYNDLEKFYREY